MDVKMEATPNPNAMKFTSTQGAIFDGRVVNKKGEDVDHPLIRDLLALDGVDNIFGYQDFLTVNKTFDAKWDELMPKVQEAFKNYQG